MQSNGIFIYKPSGGILTGHEGSPIYVSVKYVAQTMGVAYLEASCSDTWPMELGYGYYIKWGAGFIDGIDHFFYLYTTPQPECINTHRRQYSGMLFYDAGSVLKRALWTDLKLSGDNLIHYSTRDSLSTYENVAGIAVRLQACLDTYLEALPDDAPFKNYTFEVSVLNPDNLPELVAEGATTVDGFKALVAEERQFTFGDNDTVFDALNRIAEVWPTIGWCYDLSHTSTWKVSIVIGEPNFILPDHVPVLNSAASSGGYNLLDLGTGLAGVKKYIVNLDEYCNKLIPFGSDRNLPSRYYNSKIIYNGDGVLNGQSDDIAHLMLPLSKWGTTTGKWDWSDTTETERALPDPRKAVIDRTEGASEAIGGEPAIRIVRFNSETNGDIYPSLSGVTVQDLWDAMGTYEQYRPSTLYYSGGNPIDIVVGASDATDDGVIPSGGTLTDNCNIRIPQIGFDVASQVADTGLGVINMLTGMCAGRSFTIRNCTYQISGDQWLLNIERVTDSSTGMVYPNTTYPISINDKFVLTDIRMPTLYVSLAEVRLYKEAMKYYKRNCFYRYHYDIDIDSKWIKENKSGLKHFADKGYHIAIRDGHIVGNRPIYEIIFLLVDTITITDGVYPIPTYSVTTKENLYVPEVAEDSPAPVTKSIIITATSDGNVTTLTATVSPSNESVTFSLSGGIWTTAPTLVDNGDNTAVLTFNTAAGTTDTVGVQATLDSDTSVLSVKTCTYTAEEQKSVAITMTNVAGGYLLTAAVTPSGESVVWSLDGGTWTTAPTLTDNGDNTATIIFNTAAGSTDSAKVIAKLASDTSVSTFAWMSYTADEEIDPLSTDISIALKKEWLSARMDVDSSTPQALVFADSAQGYISLIGTAGGISVAFPVGSGARHDISDILNSTWHSNSLFVNPDEAYVSPYTQTVWSTEWDGTQALAALQVYAGNSVQNFTFAVKQKITPTPSALVGLGYRDWAIDFKNGYLYSVAYSLANNYLDDGSNEMVIAKFALPTGSDVTLTDADVLDSFTLPVVEIRQGVMFYKNHIYIAHGAKNVGKNTMGVTDISLKSKSVVAEVDVMSAVSSYIDEIQNVLWYNGNLCISGNSRSRTYVRVLSLY